MSKRPFIYEDESPNIVIVPTVSFSEDANPPAKKTKLDNNSILIKPTPTKDTIQPPIPGITPPPIPVETPPPIPGISPLPIPGISPPLIRRISPPPIPGISPPPIQLNHMEMYTPMTPGPNSQYSLPTVNTVPIVEYTNPVVISQSAFTNNLQFSECISQNYEASSVYEESTAVHDVKNLEITSKSMKATKVDITKNTNITSWASNYLMRIGQVYEKPIKMNLISRKNKKQEEASKTDSNATINNPQNTTYSKKTIKVYKESTLVNQQNLNLKPNNDLKKYSKVPIKKPGETENTEFINKIKEIKHFDLPTKNSGKTENTEMINKTKEIKEYPNLTQDILNKRQKALIESKSKSTLVKKKILLKKSNEIAKKSTIRKSDKNRTDYNNLKHRTHRRSCSPNYLKIKNKKPAAERKERENDKKSSKQSSQETTDKSLKRVGQINTKARSKSTPKTTSDEVTKKHIKPPGEDKVKTNIKSQIKKVITTSSMPSCSYKTKFQRDLNRTKCSTSCKRTFKDKKDIQEANISESDNFDLRSILSRPNVIMSRQNLNTYFSKIRKKSVDNITKDRDNLIITVPNDTNEEQTSIGVEEKYQKKAKKGKAKKYKEIKLVIKVLCPNSESSDSDEEKTGKCVLEEDLSFLDDINIDEIVESLHNENKSNSIDSNSNNSSKEISILISDDESSDASTVHLEELSEIKDNLMNIKQENEIETDTESKNTIVEDPGSTSTSNRSHQIQHFTFNRMTHEPLIPITKIKQEVFDDSQKNETNSVSLDKTNTISIFEEPEISCKEIKQEPLDSCIPQATVEILNVKNNSDKIQEIGSNTIENSVIMDIKKEHNNNIGSLNDTTNNFVAGMPESKLVEPNDIKADPISSANDAYEPTIGIHSSSSVGINISNNCTEMDGHMAIKPCNLINLESILTKSKTLDDNVSIVHKDLSKEIDVEVVEMHPIQERTPTDTIEFGNIEPNITDTKMDASEEPTEESKSVAVLFDTQLSTISNSSTLTVITTNAKTCIGNDPKSAKEDQHISMQNIKDIIVTTKKDPPNKEEKKKMEQTHASKTDKVDNEEHLDMQNTGDIIVAMEIDPSDQNENNKMEQKHSSKSDKDDSKTSIDQQNTEDIIVTTEKDPSNEKENMKMEQKLTFQGDKDCKEQPIDQDNTENIIVTSEKSALNDKECKKLGQKLTSKPSDSKNFTSDKLIIHKFKTNNAQESEVVKSRSHSPIRVKFLPTSSNKPQTGKQDKLENLKEGERYVMNQLEKRMSGYLKEPYSISSVIHRGAYSEVFLCKNPKGQKYAVKVLGMKSDRYYNGILKEKMLMAMQKDIPTEDLNFVHLINGFSLGSRWCFLMEYCSTNLAKVLEANSTHKPFHINEVQKLSRQLVSAVTVLRHNKVIHADIKPEHILLNSTYTILKLGGFDEACYCKDDSPMRPDVGTVNYRPPEIILGYSAGYNIDVWSTGLVMYEMATRRQLFPGTSDNDILFKQICTVGTIPLDMIKQSLFADEYFRGPFFIKYLEPNNCILKHQAKFYKNTIMESTILNTYYNIWGKMLSRKQKAADITKLYCFINLLEQMLAVHPNNRLPIEFVYANRFLFEFNC